MKDVDHFQTIEVRVTLSLTDISHLYFLLARAECQDDWNECIFDFRNRRLLAEFADALKAIPNVVTEPIKHECTAAIYHADIIMGLNPDNKE